MGVNLTFRGRGYPIFSPVAIVTFKVRFLIIFICFGNFAQGRKREGSIKSIPEGEYFSSEGVLILTRRGVPFPLSTCENGY